MKALVTGGAGFIGSHLVERLVRSEYEVVVLDDLSTGSRFNLADVADRNDVTFVLGSVLNESLVTDLLAGMDVVFHLAAAVGVKTVLDDPLGAMRTNLGGTEIVLEAARRQGSRVMVVSSSEIYGHNCSDALSEDALRVIGSPLTARWSYAEAKAIDETLAYAYWRYYEVPTVIVRPFNIVGPRQTGRYGMVIPRFVDQALTGLPLTVHGDGRQTRCFCHVADAVEAFVGLMENSDAYGEVFNIGRCEEVSIAALAHRVIDIVGSKSGIRYVPYANDYPEGFEDMRRRVPDIQKARNLIGFDPLLGLDDILQSVVQDRAHALTTSVGGATTAFEETAVAPALLPASELVP